LVPIKKHTQRAIRRPRYSIIVSFSTMLYFSIVAQEKIKGTQDSDHTDISIHRPVPDGRMPSSLT
jgi:hypothetical protein